jgi:hypothetical protein
MHVCPIYREGALERGVHQVRDGGVDVVNVEGSLFACEGSTFVLTRDDTASHGHTSPN